MGDILALVRRGHFNFGITLLSKNQLIQSHCLFPPRKGNQIKAIYSNAYNNEELTEGYFTDICNAIDESKESIVIAAWALDVREKLGTKDGKTLGDRLASAAKRGVKIVIVAWDSTIPTQKDSIPAFEKWLNSITDNNVYDHINVIKSKRPLGYSDHQKMIVVDSQTLYIGGLDLTHSRENPKTWHDAHIAIQGPCVKDALNMIQARWLAISPAQCIKHKKQQFDEVYQQGKLNLAEAVEKSHGYNMIQNDGLAEDESTMQLIVGITKNAYGSKSDWEDAYGAAESSNEVQQAYIDVVNNSKKFLYMENQYFSGPRDGATSCNEVLDAIINKIIQMYKENKDFHFYCLLPYFPNGDPHSYAIQTLMRRQWKTLQYFINKINAGTNGNAAKYVTFFNTGELKQNGLSGKPDYEQKYPHAKLLIADDETLLIGSANLNERSLAGERDSEAMLLLRGQKKQIQEYRVALMKEHFGEDVMNEVDAHGSRLESPQCVKTINKHLKENLDLLETAQKIYATPWGNISQDTFFKNGKPHLIPDRSPLVARVAMAVPYLKKLLY